MGARPRVVVVGGGLSGVATAWFLQRDHPDFDVEVLEASDRLGGKLQTATLAGQPFDVGADAFLFRQPHFADLCEELGLGDRLVAPATSNVFLLHDGALRALPTGTILGIPGDLDALEASGLLSDEAVARARGEAFLGPPTLGPDDDPPVGEFVAQRFGQDVVDVLVDPLLSGIYAGSTARLGLRSAAPAIASLADVAAKTGATMSQVAALRREANATDDRPVFKTVVDGLQTVVERMAKDIDFRVGHAVQSLSWVAQQWHLDGQPIDAVAFATPAWQTTRIVAAGAPKLSTVLDHINYAGATVIALAFPAGVDLPDGSGMLIPRREGRMLKAVTWSSRKWPHLASREHVLLRCSMGRVDDNRHDLLSDDEILATALAELGEILGIDQPPEGAIIRRWARGLPQYDSGHLRRVREAKDIARERGIVLTGAAFEGVGLPACVRQAAEAAEQAAAIALSRG